MGIQFKECSDPANIPFEDQSFDIIINRHGDFNVQETYRLLKNKGMFITEQVGGDNDRDLVEMVLPGTQPPFPHMNLKEQKKYLRRLGSVLYVQKKRIDQFYFMMLVLLCGLRALFSGNFLVFQ